MAKPILSASVSEKTLDRVDDYAEQRGISRSEATQRLIDKALDIEENDKVVVQTDGGQVVDRLNKIDRQLTEVDEGLDQQFGTIDEEIKMMQVRLGFIGLVAVIVWSVSVLASDLSLLITGGTGLLIVLYFSYMLIALGGYIK